jgi:hypothetical protein
MSTPPNAQADTRAHTPLRRVIVMAVGLTAVLAVILLAFSWPAVTSEPKDISLAVAGPEQAVTAFESQLSEQGDVFEVTIVDDRAEAVAGIEEREYFGAVILGDEAELLTASANGTVGTIVGQLATPLQTALTAQAAAAAQAQGIDAPEITLIQTDVVPYSADDPNGSKLASAAFPILFGGMIGGIALSILVVGAVRRLVGATVYSVVGGIVLALIMQSWLGSVQGSFWTNAAAFALAIGAIAAPIIGVVSLIGRAGIAVGPVVMMLFANPISGAALPSQFLPGAWGEIGQWFPPGASATLIRDLSYFPDASTAPLWLALGGWAVLGVALALLGHSRTAVASSKDS